MEILNSVKFFRATPTEMTSQTSILQLAPPPAFRRVTNVNSPFYKGEINSNKSGADDEDDDISELGENSYLSLPMSC